jgi:hypothetical protein
MVIIKNNFHHYQTLICHHKSKIKSEHSSYKSQVQISVDRNNFL